MASSIDYRVVEAQFRNGSFEKNIQQSTKSLEAFKKALDLDESAKSLEKLDSAAGMAGLKGLEQQITKVSDKFSAMGVVAFTVLQRITNAAIDTGVKLAKSLSIDQISAGWNKYEAKTSNVQTLVNATGKSVEAVNGYLDKLMMFSDETSYDFATMSASLAQMVTSGGDVDRLIPMIEGIANATSFAGKGANEFSRAIYNLNQSYGQGFLTLMDWRSVEMAGVASKQLKETFIDVGKALGKLDAEGRTASGTLVDIGNFSTTLAEKWADREVLEMAFGRFASVTEAAYELVQKGMADTYSQAYAMLEGQFDQVYYRAALAAQEAKTFGEAINSVKDAVSSGWMATFDYIFGSYDKAKEIWTNLANDLWDVFAAGGKERNDILKVWAADVNKTFEDGSRGLGGQQALWEGLTNVFQSFLRIVFAIQEGFREIFPRKTAQELADMTFKFRDFTKNLEISDAAFEKIKTVASGLASVLKILITPIQAILGLMGKVIVSAAPLGSHLLTFASYVGSLVTNLANAISSSRIIEGVFETLTHVVTGLAGAFRFVIGIIAEGVSAFAHIDILNFQAVSDEFAKIPPLGAKVGETFKTVGDSAKKNLGAAGEIAKKIGSAAEGIKNTIVNVCRVIANALQPVANRIKEIFKGVTMADVVGTTLLFGLYEQFKKMVKALAKMKTSFAEVSKAITNTLNIAGDTLKSFQNKVNAETLKSIAISVGILAASLFLISRVDSTKMAGSLTAVAALFGELALILGLLGKKKLAIGNKELITLSASMIGMSISLSILAGAIKKIASVENVDAIGEATIAIAALMTTMATLSGLLSRYAGDKDIYRLSAVIIAFGASIRILANSLSTLSTIQWSQVWPGLLGLAGALTSVVTAMIALKSPKLTGSLENVASSLIGLGLGLMALVVPVKVLSNIPYDNLKQATKTILELMAAITIVMTIMKTSSIFTKNFGFEGKFDKLASSLLAIGLSLSMIILPVKALGTMPYDQLEQGLNAVVSMLTGLTIAIMAMKVVDGDLTKVALAIGVLAAAINALVIPITTLGLLPWKVVALGLASVVAIIATLGTSVVLMAKFGAAMSAITPALTGFAVGAGVLIISIGLLAGAMATLATLGTAGVAGLVAFLQGVKIMAPAIEEGLVSLFGVLANVVKRVAPAIVESLLVLIDEFWKHLTEYTPSIIDNMGRWLVQVFDGLTVWAPELQRSVGALFRIVFGDVTKEKILKDLALSTAVLVGMLKSLSIAKKWAKDALLSTGASAAVIIGIGGALGLIQTFGDVDKMTKSALGLSTAMFIMANAMKAASPIAAIGPEALLGIGYVAAAIAAIAVLAGILSEIPLVGDLLETGFESLGRALGLFVGGISAGFKKATEDVLPSFGKSISEFWNGTKEFLNGISQMNDSVFTNITKLGLALVELTGATLLNGISNFLGILPFWKNAGLSGLGKDLAEAASGFEEFFTKMDSLDDSSIDKGVKIISSLAEASTKLPRQGGVVGLVMGNRFLSLFAKELSVAAPNIVAMADSLGSLTESDATQARYMANVITEVATCTDSVPKYAGLQQMIFGQNLISLFAEELSIAAPHIVDFLTTMSEAPADRTSLAKESAVIITSLADAAQNIPQSSIRTGTNGIANFGKNLKSLGEGISEYSNTVANANIPAMEGCNKALKDLIEAIAGVEVIDTMKKKIKDVGDGILISITNLVDNMVVSFANRSSDFQDIGKYYVQGLEKGLLCYESKERIKNASVELSNLLDGKVRKALGIASPSKKGELIGIYYDLGIARGLNGNKKKVLLAARTITNDMLKNGDITMSELQEIYDEFGVRLATAENKQLFMLSAYNRQAMTQMDEDTKSGFTDIVNTIRDKYWPEQANFAGTEMANALDEGLSSGDPAGVGRSVADKFLSGVQSSLNKFSTQIQSRSLEQQVWTALFGSTATAAEQQAVEIKTQTSKLELNLGRLSSMKEKYEYTFKKYGAESEETRSAYNDYLQEMLSVTEGANSLQEILNKDQKSSADQMVAWARYVAETQEQLKDQGFTIEQIRRAATRATGYDPDAVETKTETGAQNLVDLALAATKGAFEKSSDGVLGALTDSFLEYGQKSSNNWATGIQNGSPKVVSNTDAVGQSSVQTIKSYGSQFEVAGTDLMTRLADSIRNNGGNVQAALREVLDSLAGVSVSVDTGDRAARSPRGARFTPGLGVSPNDGKREVVTAGGGGGGSRLVSTVTSGMKKPVSGAFAKSKASNVASSIGGNASTTVNNTTNNFNFTQNNTSPKALDRLGIYRDTSGMFNRYKSKLEGYGQKAVTNNSGTGRHSSGRF